MKSRYTLPLVALLAVAGALGACSDEKKKAEPAKVTPPAETAKPADPAAKPADPAMKPADPAKPAEAPKPADKH